MKAIYTLLFASVWSISAADWQALPETAPAPADNPATAAKVELGKHVPCAYPSQYHGHCAVFP